MEKPNNQSINYFSFIVILLLFSNTAQGQVIDIDGEKINCDSAYTTYDLGLCSRYHLDESINLYDSVFAKVIACIDTLIADDNRMRTEMSKNNPKQTFEFWTDYRHIKEMYIQSNKLFKQYAEIEMQIEGEFYGLGRERTIGENMRLKEIYDYRIGELIFLLKNRCNF